MFDLVFDIFEQLILSVSDGINFLTFKLPNTDIIIPGGVSVLTMFTFTFLIGYITYAVIRWILV